MRSSPASTNRDGIGRRIGFLELLENRHLLTAAFELLVDTDTSTQSLVRSPSSIVDFGESVAFVAETETSNPKVWLSPDIHDQALMEIELPHGVHVQTHFPFEDDLLISGYSKVPSQSGLWRSDGTVGGTERISSTTTSSVVTANSIGYFIGRASEYEGYGVWQTDGTAGGTKKLVTESGEQNFRFTSPLSVLGDRLYFIVADHRSERYLATFDVATASIRPLHTFPLGRTNQIEPLSDRLVMSNDPGLGSSQEELYSFEPSSNRLTKLPFAPGFRGVQTGVLLRLGNRVLFPRHDGVLYATDGTAEGTEEFFDFEFQVATRQPNIASIDGSFLVAGYGPQGDGYYFTDGTAANTVHVGLVPFRHPYHPPIATATDAYYVFSEEIRDRSGLYRIDAESAMVQRVADLASLHSQELPDPFSDFGTFPAVVGERVLFSDRIDGVAVLREYFPSDGSVRTITSGEGTAADETSWWANDDSHVWFESAGTIWQSSGTPSTTFELNYGGESLYAESAVLSQVIGGKLTLEAQTTTFRSPFFRWQVDPSSGVATQLGELQNVGISQIFELNGKHFQLRNVDGLTAAVFELDESLLPTRRLADVPPHFFASEVPVYLLGDRAIFTVEGQLWQTDGTQVGSHRLGLDVESERVVALRSDASGIVDVVTDQDRLYRLTESSRQPELVAEVPLKLFGVSTSPRFIGLPEGIVTTDESVEVNQGLWFVDRATGRTELLVDVAGRASGIDAAVIGLAGGKAIAFSGSDQIGYSLWATDGTREGTVQIAYERYGYPFWHGSPNVAANTKDGRLVLSWFTQELGRELFITDGTALGTLPLSDIASGPAESNAKVAIWGELIFATGATDAFGRSEPFVAEVPAAAESPDDRFRFFVQEKSAGAKIGVIIPPDLSLEQIDDLTLVGSNSNAEFVVDPSSGWLSLSGDSFYDFSLLAEDEILLDVVYREVGTMQTQTRRVTVEVEVLDQLEPLLIQDQVFEIDENLEAFQYVGKVDVAFDAQLGVSFSYAGGDPFFVDRDTGRLQVMTADYLLDYELRQEFIVIVQVTDGLEAKQARMTIRLRDVNEPPMVDGPIGGVDFRGFDFFSGETARIVLGIDAFRDPEGTEVTYRLEQADGAEIPAWMIFTVATTELIVSPRHGDIGKYLLKLIATDATGLSVSTAIDVRVFSGLRPWHNVLLPFDVNDDGFVSPMDALIVINQLNLGADQLAASNSQFEPFVDTSGDGGLSPLDALLVVNYLNGPAGESEFPLHPDVELRREPKPVCKPFWGFVGWWERSAPEQSGERRRDGTSGRG